MTIHRTDRPAILPAARRFRALRDADDQQRDDQRDDRHLQRVEPQRRRSSRRPAAPARAGRRRATAANARQARPTSKREQRPNRRAAADRCAAAAVLLAALRSTRLPEAEHEAVGLAADLRVEDQQACGRRPGCAAGRCSASSTKPARSKSALTTAGSIRCSFSTTCARVAAGPRDMVDDADDRARLHRRIDGLEPRLGLHPRDLALGALPIDVVIIEVHDHEVVALLAGSSGASNGLETSADIRLPSRRTRRMAACVLSLRNCVGCQTMTLPRGPTAGADDLGPIAVGAEHIDDPHALLEPEEVEHLGRLAAFVELDIVGAPRRRARPPPRHRPAPLRRKPAGRSTNAQSAHRCNAILFIGLPLIVGPAPLRRGRAIEKRHSTNRQLGPICVARPEVLAPRRLAPRPSPGPASAPRAPTAPRLPATGR